MEKIKILIPIFLILMVVPLANAAIDCNTIKFYNESTAKCDGNSFFVYYDNGQGAFGSSANVSVTWAGTSLNLVSGDNPAYNKKTHTWGFSCSQAGTYQFNLTAVDVSGAPVCEKTFLSDLTTGAPLPSVSVSIPDIAVGLGISRFIIGTTYTFDLTLDNTGDGIANNIKVTLTNDSFIRADFIESDLGGLAGSTSDQYALTFTPLQGANPATLTAEISYEDSDGNQYLASDSYEFIINYNPLDPNIPNISFLEDGYDDSLDLDNYININEEDVNASESADGNPNSYNNITWSSSGLTDTNINVDMDPVTHVVNFTAATMWSGSADVTFTATDTDSGSNSQTITITVGNVNDQPVISGLPDKETDEDITPTTNFIDLYGYTTDEDNTIDELTFTVSLQTNLGLIDCEIVSNRYVNCGTPALNQYGYSDVTVKASDGNSFTEDSFRMTVNSVNDAPVLNDITNKTITEGNVFDVNVSEEITATDVENSALTFTYSSPLDSNGNWNTTYEDAGTYNISVNVSDGSLIDTKSFILTVNDVSQGANDTVNGNLSKVDTSIANLGLDIDGVDYSGQTLVGEYTLNFSDAGETVVAFDWDFSESSKFNFNNIIIDKTLIDGLEGIVIGGIDLTSQDNKKTIYLNQTDTTKGAVCIKDAEIGSITEVSSGCNGANERVVYCDGQPRYGYSCTDLGDVLRISGLVHSGVRQNPRVIVDGDGVCDDDEDCVNDDCGGVDRCKTTDTAGGGGSGGGGGGFFRTTQEPAAEEEEAAPAPEEETTTVEEEAAPEETTPAEETVAEEVPPIVGQVVRIGGLEIPRNRFIGWSVMIGIVVAGLLVYNFIFRAKPKARKKR